MNLLACKRADLVRAIASNAGGGPSLQTEVWPNHYPKCPGQRSLAAIALHGNADVNVPLASGFFTAQYWAYVNGCDDTGLDSTGYAECASYRHCPKGANVVWCEVSEARQRYRGGALPTRPILCNLNPADIIHNQWRLERNRRQGRGWQLGANVGGLR